MMKWFLRKKNKYEAKIIDCGFNEQGKFVAVVVIEKGNLYKFAEAVKTGEVKANVEIPEKKDA